MREKVRVPARQEVSACTSCLVCPEEVLGFLVGTGPLEGSTVRGVWDVPSSVPRPEAGQAGVATQARDTQMLFGGAT
jgi:hypothetical protein